MKAWRQHQWVSRAGDLPHLLGVWFCPSKFPHELDLVHIDRASSIYTIPCSIFCDFPLSLGTLYRHVVWTLSTELLLFGGEDALGMGLASQPVIGPDQLDLHEGARFN